MFKKGYGIHSHFRKTNNLHFYIMSFFYKIRLIKVKNSIKQHVILFLHVKSDTSQQKLV